MQIETSSEIYFHVHKPICRAWYFLCDYQE